MVAAAFNGLPLCVLLQVWGSPRGSMTNGDHPVTLIQLTVTAFLAGSVWGEVTDRHLGWLSPTGRRWACASPAQGESPSRTDLFCSRARPGSARLAHPQPFIAFVTAHISVTPGCLQASPWGGLKKWPTFVWLRLTAFRGPAWPGEINPWPAKATPLPSLCREAHLKSLTGEELLGKSVSRRWT